MGLLAPPAPEQAPTVCNMGYSHEVVTQEDTNFTKPLVPSKSVHIKRMLVCILNKFNVFVNADLIL